MQGNLRRDYDVILIAEQNLSRQTVMQAPAARPVPYQQSAKYKFLGVYGSSPDITGGFGQKGVDAFQAFLEGGGTLIAVGESARLPIEFGWAGTVDKTPVPGLTAQRPLVEAEIVRPEHPAMYGYGKTTIPVKYVGGTPFKVGIANENNVLARYVGGEVGDLRSHDRRRFAQGAAVRRGRAQCREGQGPCDHVREQSVYRWQNHGEFGMIFNSIINWNDAVERRNEADAADRAVRVLGNA